MKRFEWVLMATGAALLAGCGQKGPLYMPDQATEIVTRPTQTPATSTPQNGDAPPAPANPAPEPTAPDKDKKEQSAPPR